MALDDPWGSLGQPWELQETTLEPLGAPLGLPEEPLGSLWGPSWAPLGLQGSIWEGFDVQNHNFWLILHRFLVRFLVGVLLFFNQMFNDF